MLSISFCILPELAFRISSTTCPYLSSANEGVASYGMIPGAVNIPADKLESEYNRQIAEIPKEKKLRSSPYSADQITKAKADTISKTWIIQNTLLIIEYT